jgi:hypothetical protein
MEGKEMRFSESLLHRRTREIWPGQREREAGYFDMHPPGEVFRGIVYTSVLWGLLAFGVYTIYGMVAGVR